MKQDSGDSSVAKKQATISEMLHNTVASVAGDTLLRVMQGNFGIDHGAYMNNKNCCASTCHSPVSTQNASPTPNRAAAMRYGLQRSVERTMGVAASGLMHSPEVAGNSMVRNHLREEFGGKPTTHLHSKGETVPQYFQRTGKDSRSTRFSRNNLCDLSTENDDVNEAAGTPKKSKSDSKMFKERKERVMSKLFDCKTETTDTIKRKKIKYTMKNFEDEQSMVSKIFKTKSDRMTDNEFVSSDEADKLINFFDDDSDIE